MGTQQINNTILVAVPYYGSLSLPPLGLSRLFSVVVLDTASSKVGGMEVRVNSWCGPQYGNAAIAV
jgi:hypothetical protein